ncbi:acyltransferase family protein [Nocardioides anomalus]|uniref:Acyltransferase family protein n=1 Tax=Nocardioides anomalus TaxID=2712223 RepID=A0A6G6WFL9_9ACTN|nr:acyltransferase family protein [Nocardioides anomalus]QIG44032.1 acyltransferase family protein [Nocardioides anomalus]
MSSTSPTAPARTPAAAPAAGAAAGPAPAKARDPWFDNAKMGLVLLVVVGHSWTLLPRVGAVSHLYDSLYLWHVPAFVFVTGYLSRSFAYTPARMWQLVRTVAIPYVLFECALALFRIYLGGEQLRDVFQDPHWPMWYLSALFFWRLATPVFKAVPALLAVPVAIAISLAGGMVADSTFDFFRICGFLPFFVLGLKATPERLEVLRAPWARTAGILGFLAILVGATWMDQLVGSTDWLYYSYGYQDLGASDAHGLAVRAGLLAVGLVGALSFFALIPRAGGWFTTMGAATLVVYLFHGFVIKGAEYAGYADWAAGHAAIAFALTTAGAVALALVLAWSPVARVLNHAVDPFGTAEKHVEAAVQLAAAPTHAEQIAGAIEEAASDRPLAAR